MKYYIDLGKKLFPLNRSLTGIGTLKTLKILKNENNFIKLKKIKCGNKVFDWKIPSEWKIRSAFIKDKNGKKIVDFKKNNLHLVGYSQKIDKKIKFINLLKKLHSLPKSKTAIPYKTSYYRKDWGFCISDILKKKLLKKYKSYDLFHIKINSSFKKNGYLNYAEAYLPGKSKKEILISTYVCHPSMANNELSGPLLSLSLINFFCKYKNEKSLRFLFVPETIGAIAYIKKNYNQLIKNVIGGYVLSCVGDNKKHSYIKTKYGKSPSDFAIRSSYKSLKIKGKIYSFLDRGSDERQYNSSGVNIPIGTIMRSKFGTFKEYHTSLDNFKLVNAKGLKGSFNVAKKAIEYLMKYKKPKKNIKKKKLKKKIIISTIKCEPFLEKRKLYPKDGMSTIKDSNQIKSNQHFIKLVSNILNFMQYSDGLNDIEEISKFIKQPLSETKKIFLLLKKLKMVKIKEI